MTLPALLPDDMVFPAHWRACVEHPWLTSSAVPRRSALVLPSSFDDGWLHLRLCRNAGLFDGALVLCQLTARWINLFMPRFGPKMYCWQRIADLDGAGVVTSFWLPEIQSILKIQAHFGEW